MPISSQPISTTEAVPAVSPPELSSIKAPHAERVELLGKIQQMSERLFPGPVTMEYASDPEDPSKEYIVFDVVADGEFEDYRDVEFQWHDEIEKMALGVVSEFRLCVHPKP